MTVYEVSGGVGFSGQCFLWVLRAWPGRWIENDMVKARYICRSLYHRVRQWTEAARHYDSWESVDR